MRYQIKRKGTVVVEVEPIGTQDRQAMGVNIVEMEFSLLEPVEILQGDTVIVYGEEYFFPTAKADKTKDTSSLMWKYKLQFVHHSYRLANYPYAARNKDNKLLITNFSYTGNLAAHFALFMQNLNEYETGWTSGVIDDTEIRTITYSDNNLLNTLNKWTDEFKTEFWIENKTIHLTKRIGNSGISLGYGKGKGLISLNQTVKDRRSIFTRLIAQGGDKNLPTDYGYTNLQLPAATNGYIEDADKRAKYGIIVATKTFEDIIPERIGTVTQVGDEFTFYDSTLDFDISQYYLPEITPKIGFQTGQLAGLLFPITSYDHVTRRITIGVNEDEKIVQIPNSDIKPAIGDKYSIFYISLPQEYITDAQNRLLAAATEYYNVGSDENYGDEYTIVCDKYYFQKNNIVPILGYNININNPEPLLFNVEKRISGIKRNLQDEWDYQLTVSDDIGITQTARSFLQQDKIYSLFAAISNKELTTNNQSFLGQLSGNDGYLYIAGQKAKAGFADVAQDAIHSYHSDIAEVADIAREVVSVDYVSGLAGKGHKLVDGVLEVDHLIARKSFETYELIRRKVTGIGGSFAVTDDMKILSVTGTGPYICTFDTDDGTVPNYFNVGDIVRCQINDSLKQKYYVARVNAVTSNSFTLSILGGSGIPAPGDVLYRFDNDIDVNRKGLIYMTNSDSGAPYIDFTYGFYTDPTNRTKVRLGNTEGIYDVDFGGFLSGYNLYADGAYLKNVYAKGRIIALAGSNVYNKAEIDDAVQTINDQIIQLDTQLANYASDGILNGITEKQPIKLAYDAAAGEVEDLKTQAALLDVSSADYNSAFLDLQNFVLPLLADLTSVSYVDGAQLRGKFNAYGVQKSLLVKAIAQKQQEVAQDANDKIDGLQIANENLLKDSSFERLRLPDTPLLSTPGGPTPFTTITRSSTAAVDGSSSAKIQIDIFSPSNHWAFATLAYIANNILYHAPYGTIDKLKGKTVTYSVSIMALGNAANKPMNICYAQTGPNSTVSTSVRIPITLGPANVWRRHNVSFDVSPATTYLNIYFEFKDTDGWQVGDAILIDCDFLGIGNKAPEGWLPSPFDVFETTAKLITLSAATQIIQVDKDGNRTPANPFTVTGVAQNTTITSWQYSVDGGTYTSTTPTGVSRSGSTVTVNPNTVTFKTLAIRASDGTYSDTLTIAVARDGVDGEDGAGIAIKGSVPTYADLASLTGLASGDAYLVEADGKLYIWDEFQFPADGNGVEFKGDKGEDGYAVLLGNEAHIFPGTEDSAISSSTQCEVMVYKGATQIPAVVSVGPTPAGMSASVSGNTITFSVTSALTQAHGTIPITITADGKTFVRPFSYSIAFKGADGISITDVDIEFAKNTNPTSAPATGWTTTPPILGSSEQLWTRTKTSYSSGSPTYSTPVNITPKEGVAGKGITSIVEEYYLSTSKTTQTGGSWVTAPPTWEFGKYMWTRVKITYSDSTTSYTTPIVSSEWEVINDLKVGGENLLNNSEAPPLSPNDTGTGTTVLMTDETIPYRRATPATNRTVSLYGANIAYSAGETYIASIDVRHFEPTSIVFRLRFSVEANSVLETEVPPGVWTRITSKAYTFPSNTNANLIFSVVSAPGVAVDYRRIQIEEGNVATSWKPSLSDTQAKITAAQTAADNAQAAAVAAATAAENLEEYVDGAFKDGVIEAAEAKSIEKYINIVNETYEQIVNSYNVVYNDPLLTGTPKTNLATAKTNLDSSKNSLLSAINTAIADGKTTPAEKTAVDNAYTDFKNKIGLYTTAVENAYKSITDSINTKTDTINNEVKKRNRTFENASNIPNDGYLAGDNIIQKQNETIQGKTFIAGKTYTTKTTRTALVPGWVDDWTADIDADDLGNKTYTSTPTSYKKGDIWTILGFNNVVVSGKTFEAGKSYIAKSSSSFFNANDWELLMQIVDSEWVVNGSIAPPLKEKDWNLGGNTIQIISDAKEGNEVLRMTVHVSTASKYFIPVGPTKVYRVSFWARRSANNNGKLYFSLRQYQDKGITPCSVNSGRSPYKPSGLIPEINWTYYEFTWSGNDWQEGVKYVQPEFLGNYQGTQGYIEINAFKMVEVTAVEQLGYIKEAFQASTEISGGLVLSSVIATRDSSNVVRAYMSGAASNPVAFAAGVSDFGLPSETRVVAIRHNGSGYLASGNISWDTVGNLTVTGVINATSGVFNGTVYADSGKIGMLDISPNQLQLNNIANSSSGWDQNERYVSWTPDYFLLRKKRTANSQHYVEFSWNLYSGIMGTSSYQAASAIVTMPNTFYGTAWNIGVRSVATNADRNIAYWGEGDLFLLGNNAMFSIGYRGTAYTNTIRDYFDRTHIFVFNALGTGSSPINVHLPTPSDVLTKTGTSSSMFILYIAITAGTPSYIRLVPASGRDIKNNNGGSYGNFDMSQGDTAMLLYVNGDWYIFGRMT